MGNNIIFFTHLNFWPGKLGKMPDFLGSLMVHFLSLVKLQCKHNSSWLCPLCRPCEGDFGTWTEEVQEEGDTFATSQVLKKNSSIYSEFFNLYKNVWKKRFSLYNGLKLGQTRIYRWAEEKKKERKDWPRLILRNHSVMCYKIQYQLNIQLCVTTTWS